MSNLRLEIKRKIFHIFSILLLLIPLYLFGKFSVAVIMFFMVVFLFPISFFRIRNIFTLWFWKIIDLVERKENIKVLPARQAFSLAVGILITSLVFDEKILQISIISTAVYDGFATIIGLLIGKHKFPWGKSLEGTLGGILFNTLALSMVIPVEYAFIISLFVAVVENLSRSDVWFLDDNLLIPVFTGLFSWFLDIPAELPQFFFSFL
ncbi:diacylglycerol/polyprenol kinase family protein [Persephonella sp.]